MYLGTHTSTVKKMPQLAVATVPGRRACIVAHCMPVCSDCDAAATRPHLPHKSLQQFTNAIGQLVSKLQKGMYFSDYRSLSSISDLGFDFLWEQIF